MNSYLQDNTVFEKFLFYKAVNEVGDVINQAPSNNRISVGIFLDVHKAFDSVDHNRCKNFTGMDFEGRLETFSEVISATAKSSCI